MGITLKEIAKLANVSVSTVSNIINQKHKSYSEETREKVQELLQEHKYIPNCSARALTGKHIKNIAFIMTDITNPFFHEITKAIGEVCYKHECNLWLCHTEGDKNKELKYIKMVMEHGANGIIFAAPAYRVEAELKKLAQYGVPIVIIDDSTKIEECNTITINNFLGSLKATRYLIEKGHTNIAYLGKEEYFKSTQERVDGFVQAMREAQLDSTQIVLGHKDMRVDKELMKELIAGGCSAIVAGNDSIASGVYVYCKENQIKIPKQLSVIGFDDVPLANLMAPKLTTIRQPIYSIGEWAVEKIIQCIEGQQVEQHIQIITPQLIERESVVFKDN